MGNFAQYGVHFSKVTRLSISHHANFIKEIIIYKDTSKVDEKNMSGGSIAIVFPSLDVII